LEIVGKHFDTRAISERSIDEQSVLDYFQKSSRGYRLFHSKEGAMHVALNRQEEFTPEGYLGQVELIAASLASLAARQVLEIGCGTGYNVRNLAQRLPECQYTGVDLSDKHVESARRESSKLTNVQFEQGNFQQLRFDAEQFDAVFAVECLCQASDMQKSLFESFRVLRPGGRLIVIDCFRPAPLDSFDDDLQLAARLVEKTMAVDQFMELADWIDLAQSTGFRLLEQNDLSASISHNIARFYSLSRRFFKMPRAARAFLSAFPRRLLENAISGLLMPFTVGDGVHGYYLCVLERPDQ